MSKKSFGCGKKFKRKFLLENGWKPNGMHTYNEQWSRPEEIGRDKIDWIALEDAVGSEVRYQRKNK